MRLGVLALALGLAACAGAPPHPGDLPARQRLEDFEMEARFALKTERPNETPQSASGRLSWRHAGKRDHILVASPLGQGLAEIDITPAGAELRGSDGVTHRSADAASLLRSVTGYELPLGELSAWLLGRPAAGGRLQADAAGRPQRLVDAGWRIDYAYDNDDAQAPPARLTVQRDNEMELRLRIEAWRRLADE